jgi:hypothetical protein
MNYRTLAILAVTGLALSGCIKKSADGVDQTYPHGRYSGVGIYGPSRQWTKLIGAQQAKDPQLAQPIDDQVIIVVQDSATGEVRACGDLTGYCIGMNPWKTALVSAQIAPLRLSEHRAPDEPDATVELTAKAPKPDKGKADQSPGAPSKRD